MFSRIFVANRGAIARRIVRTCNDLGRESVVVYSDADAHSPVLQESSAAISLPGNRPDETYLNAERLIQAALESGADAVHPGYGFLAENADFARRVLDAGLAFIGPAPETMAQMGDKVAARRLMQNTRFPVFAGSETLDSPAAAAKAAQAIGYPVMLKPSGGGGGMGMRRVDRPEDLADALAQAQQIAQSAFADPAVYLEKCLVKPRHIEYQIIADHHGFVTSAFERDCSVQRRHQKLIEETPAPGLDRADLNTVGEQAVQACEQLGYNHIGTLETLYERGETGFLEMNTRIQVEHGVTEMVTGLDLVALQIKIAEGARLQEAATLQQISLNGYAVEARVYAENPNTLLPSTGTLAVFDCPTLHGVRVETGYQAGQVVSPYYDPLLVKVIAHAHTRELAIGRLCVALGAMTIRGVQTNIPLLLKILKSEDFMSGQVDTGLLERLTSG